jgi:hypothetical protein
MALATFGSATTTTLRALQVSRGLGMTDANIALFAEAILNDQGNSNAIWPGAFARTGLLYVPNRGVLQTLPGDYVVYDPATGFPFLVSKAAAAGASWVHT